MFFDEGTVGRKGFRADRRSGSKRNNNRKPWQATGGSFRCANCRQMVCPTPIMGTAHRNHCPHCLHSLHVDTRPGNRASMCRARMEPIGLTWKRNGVDKYGKVRTGDVMLVHRCKGCGMVNINRIAGDDSCSEVLGVFERSLKLNEDQRAAIGKAGVKLLQSDGAERLHVAMFGKALSP